MQCFSSQNLNTEKSYIVDLIYLLGTFLKGKKRGRTILLILLNPKGCVYYKTPSWKYASLHLREWTDIKNVILWLVWLE